MRISLIVAANERDVIGKNGGLPWHLPADLRRFKRLTMGHVVIVGRRTQDDILAGLGHSLPGRFSIVVSRQLTRANGSGSLYHHDARSALDIAASIEAFAGRDEVFVIGGAQVYGQVMDRVDRVYLTRVHDDGNGDTVMPEGWLDPFVLASEEPSGHEDWFSFLNYKRD